MSTGVPLASGKGEIFQVVLQFMPDWVQIPVLVLIVLLVVGSWGFKLKRRIDRRRAARAGRAVQVTAQHGQGRGADYLGPYAPQQAAPQLAAAQPAQQPSGADFLGAYAPQRRQGNGPA